MEGRQKKPIHIPENLTEKLRELLMKKDRLVITLLVGILLLVIALPVSDKDRDSPERMAERGDAEL